MYSLSLWGRPTTSEPYIRPLTHLATGWRRTSRAVGGYWEGSFAISEQDMGSSEMADFYQRRLGCIVREYCGGMLSWEGYIIEMRLIMDGVEHMRSLLPEWFHNRVAVRYTFPEAAVSQAPQGAWTWDPNNPQDGCEDDGFDFSPYETAAPGTATYMMEVTCTDDVVIWGFMGDVGAGGNTEIDIYEDSGLTDEGWAVQGVNRGAKTPSTYKIIDVTRAGKPTVTGWSENTDASDEYGEMNYVETVGTLPVGAAEVLRDRHLTQFAWPRSRVVGSVVGSVVAGAEPPANRLLVSVAGFWHSLNWRYLATSKPGPCYDLIDHLVAQSEFVTAGRLEVNEWEGYADCDPVPQRLGDLCSDIINQGDEDGDIWIGGVYGGKEMRYESAPSTVDYFLNKGVLTDKVGVPVLPPLAEPGFLVRVSGALLAGQPTGTSNVWDDPQVAYVDEVEFVAPDKLKLRLYGEEEGIITLLEQARMYGMMED